MEQEKIYKPRGIVLQCANLYRHMSIVPSRLPGATVKNKDGSMVINSNLPSSSLNKITHLVMEDDEDLSKQLLDLAAEFGDLPFVWWLGPDTMPENMGLRIEEMGFSQVEVLQGMNLDMRTMGDCQPRLGKEIGLHMEWAVTEDQIKIYAELLTSIMSPSDQNIITAYAQTAQKLLTPGMPIGFALARVKGQPVSGFEYWLGPGKLVGIYGLVCKPEWRNQGIATALLQHGLSFFKNEKGCQNATLQVSTMAQGLCTRLGFRPYGVWVQYTKKEFWMKSNGFADGLAN